jgi:hypothetical protein
VILTDRDDERSYHWSYADEEEVLVDMHGDNSGDLLDFGVGYVGGETWGTDYDLEDIFKDENEKVDGGRDTMSA